MIIEPGIPIVPTSDARVSRRQLLQALGGALLGGALATQAVNALASPPKPVGAPFTVVTGLPYSTSIEQAPALDTWFRYKAPNKETLTINANTVGSTYDTVLYVYDKSGALIASDDDSGPGLQASVNFTAEGGVYYFSVKSYGDDPEYGTLVFNLAQV